MCRFTLYKGKVVLLADLITRPESSVINQSFFCKERQPGPGSSFNADGFGVGWYAEDQSDPNKAKTADHENSCASMVPFVYLSDKPAYSSRNLVCIAESVSSYLVFAHVRAALPGCGETSLANCHPFRYGRWIFMHNGGLAHFGLVKRTLSNQLADALFNAIQGTTDSEHCFAVFLNFLFSSSAGAAMTDPFSGHSTFAPFDIAEALCTTLMYLTACVREAAHAIGVEPEVSLLNFAITDGETVAVCRYTSSFTLTPASLYLKASDISSDVMLSSEPLDSPHYNWMPVARNSLVIVPARGSDIVLLPLSDIVSPEQEALPSAAYVKSHCGKRPDSLLRAHRLSVLQGKCCMEMPEEMEMCSSFASFAGRTNSIGRPISSGRPISIGQPSTPQPALTRSDSFSGDMSTHRASPSNANCLPTLKPLEKNLVEQKVLRPGKTQFTSLHRPERDALPPVVPPLQVLDTSSSCSCSSGDVSACALAVIPSMQAVLVGCAASAVHCWSIETFEAMTLGGGRGTCADSYALTLSAPAVSIGLIHSIQESYPINKALSGIEHSHSWRREYIEAEYESPLTSQVFVAVFQKDHVLTILNSTSRKIVKRVELPPSFARCGTAFWGSMPTTTSPGKLVIVVGGDCGSLDIGVAELQLDTVCHSTCPTLCCPLSTKDTIWERSPAHHGFVRSLYALPGGALTQVAKNANPDNSMNAALTLIVTGSSDGLAKLWGVGCLWQGSGMRPNQVRPIIQQLGTMYGHSASIVTVGALWRDTPRSESRLVWSISGQDLPSAEVKWPLVSGEYACVAAAVDGAVRVWYSQGTPNFVTVIPRMLRAAAMCPSSNLLYCYSGDDQLHFFDVATMIVRGSISLPTAQGKNDDLDRAVIDADGQFVYISTARRLRHWASHVVSVYDPSSGGRFSDHDHRASAVSVIGAGGADRLSSLKLTHVLSSLISMRTISSTPTESGEALRTAAFYVKSVAQKLLPRADTRVVVPLSGDSSAGPPVVFVRLMAEPQAPHVVIYAHYDVVPADASGWKTDPFLMEGSNGYFYGRGMSDNKGPLVCTLFALHDLCRTFEAEWEAENPDTPLEHVCSPINVLLIIEGCQENGSRGFDDCCAELPPDWFAEIREASKVGKTAVVLSNTYWVSDTLPCIVYGLRGVIGVSVTVSGPQHNVHSGIDGGLLVEPFSDLSALLVSCRRASDVPGMLDDIVPLEPWEIEYFDRVIDSGEFNPDSYTCSMDVKPSKSSLESSKLVANVATSASEERVLARNALCSRWALPSLSVLDVSHSADKALGCGVMPAEVTARISLRTVPFQSPKKIAKLLKNHLEKAFQQLGSPNRLNVNVDKSTDWYLHRKPEESPWIQCAMSALSEVWGCSPLFVREGGSLAVPVSKWVGAGAAIIHLPLGQGSDHAHLANERMRWQNIIKGRRVFTQFLRAAAQKANSWVAAKETTFQ